MSEGSGGDARTVASWAGAIAAQEAPLETAELGQRWAALPTERAMRVTDLDDPRAAYWRLRFHVEPSARSTAFLDRGLRLHAALGEILDGAAIQEVSVRRDGVVGRIDAMGEFPLELKTSGRAVAAEALLDERPEAVAQLVTYCALTERPRGMLVWVGGPEGSPLDVAVAEFEVPDLAAARECIRALQARLRDAVRRGSTAGLPACRWREAHCPFRAAGVCDCTGGEPPVDHPILRGIAPGARRADLEVRYRERYHALGASDEGRIRSFDALIYPREAYFQRTRRPRSAPTLVTPGPGLAPDTFERLTAALESGPLGEVRRALPRADSAPDTIPVWRDLPYVVRRLRYAPRADPTELLVRFPQYFLQLGLYGVALGAAEGWLVLGWDDDGASAPPVRVYRCQLLGRGAFSRYWRDVARSLDRTAIDGEFERLVACPAWKARRCPYQPSCGCPIGPDSR
ncbi:MAG: hypothetical protein ACREB9_03590 [Thermoplasmata archaeon]